jgi:hypothetical protein
VLKGKFASSVFHSCNAKTQISVTGPQDSLQNKKTNIMAFDETDGEDEEAYMRLLKLHAILSWGADSANSYAIFMYLHMIQ